MKNYVVEFNALRITTAGVIEPIWIEDFQSEECLSLALGENAQFEELPLSENLQILSQVAAFPVRIFGDFYGQGDNAITQSLLGDFSFQGNGVLCQYKDGVYQPCTNSQLEHLIPIMQALVGFSYTIVKSVLDCFRVAGQDELEKGLELYTQGKLEEADQYFRQSALLECPDGMNALAQDYLHGEGVLEDIPNGMILMQKAIEMESPKAYVNLGFYCLDGLYGIDKNTDMALQSFEQGAKLYEPRAMAWLGYLYMSEEYDVYNTAKAAYWIQKSVELGCEDGWKFLGMLIMQDDYYRYQPTYVHYCFQQYAQMTGVSLEEVIEEAGAVDIATEIQKAASQEPMFPYVPMSVIMEDSLNPSEKYSEALELLADEDAVEEGYRLMLNLAEMGYSYACRDAAACLIDCGQGDDFLYDDDDEICAFPVDEEAAYKYMKVAALNGDTHAMRFFPFLFEDMDEKEARLFLSLYTTVTGDWVMQSAVAPFLDNLRQMDEAIPWVYPEDFFGGEILAEMAYDLYKQGEGNMAGIDAIYKIYTRLSQRKNPTDKEIEQKEIMEEHINFLMRLMSEGE